MSAVVLPQFLIQVLDEEGYFPTGDIGEIIIKAKAKPSKPKYYTGKRKRKRAAPSRLDITGCRSSFPSSHSFCANAGKEGDILVVIDRIKNMFKLSNGHLFALGSPRR